MKTSRTPCKTGLLTAVCVVAGSICMSASNEKGLISARPSERSETLPLEMQFAVSAALGKDQTEYHVSPMTPADQRGEREGYQAANPDQHFNVRFNAQGACIAINGTRWRLSVREWGYGDPGYAEGFADSPSRSAMAERGASAGSAGFYAGGGSAYGRESPTAAAPLVYANRVEYRRGALTEWYVNGPLGLQQGFTVNSPPARNATHSVAGGPARRGPGSAPLTLVLDLPAGKEQTKLDADRMGLSLLTDKGEPALWYGGLMAFDAAGQRLPAWLEIRNHTLLLRVDETGARYPITIDPFVQQAKLTASDGAARDEFGSSVALSSDGNTALIGAHGADSDRGAGYVFTLSAGTWSQQVKLTASDGAANDWFGWSVALSSNTALIGAYAANVGGNPNQGAAYVFTLSAGTWSQQTKLASLAGGEYWFGGSVALSSNGNTALISAHGADSDRGAGYVFTQSAGTWSQQAKLTASDGAANGSFGNSAALSGDGNTALIGMCEANVGGNTYQGAGYVFTRSAGNWSEQAKLTASDGAISDSLGNSAALSHDGNTALIGAWYADVGGNINQGAGYVFTRSGTSWSEQEKLTERGGRRFFFGNSAALSHDGNTALIGAYYTSVSWMYQGAGYVFTRSAGNWSEQAKLTDPDGAEWDCFGSSAALSGDGNTALIGAYGVNTNQGAGYVFTVTDSSKIGPMIKANGVTNTVTINYPDTVSVTVEMNADIYAGVEVDWWVVALAHSGEWYYLNNAMQWTLFSGDLAFCQPMYQGALFNLSSASVLTGFILPRGTYDFWFAVDYPMDGILNLAGQILYDQVTVVVQ